jgi:hyperosmotically inducible protein
MNSETSRKIIVAGGMAAVVVVGVVTLALRSQPVTSGIAQVPASAPAAVAHQKVGTSTEFAGSDTQITTDVKSQIAGDSLAKDANIGVTTTHGVVALSGNLASQDAIDHVKDVAGKVKDVKSVDGSALILASL